MSRWRSGAGVVPPPSMPGGWPGWPRCFLSPLEKYPFAPHPSHFSHIKWIHPGHPGHPPPGGGVFATFDKGILSAWKTGERCGISMPSPFAAPGRGGGGAGPSGGGAHSRGLGHCGLFRARIFPQGLTVYTLFPCVFHFARRAFPALPIPSRPARCLWPTCPHWPADGEDGRCGMVWWSPALYARPAGPGRPSMTATARRVWLAALAAGCRTLSPGRTRRRRQAGNNRKP